MSLEWVWRFSKLSPNSYVFMFLLFTFFGQEEWVWRFSKLTPKFGPNSYLSTFFQFCFFGKEEWVWSEFGDSPNSLQTHPKLAPNSYVFRFFCFICSFLFIIYFTFVGKGEWVWSEFGDSPNSPQTQMIIIFFCVFPFYCHLKHFLGREEWVWSKFGGCSNSLQTYSKLAPNSYGFILLFLLYCQLIVFSFFEKEWVFIFSVIFTGSFLRKRNEFGGSPKSLQSRWGHL